MAGRTPFPIPRFGPTTTTWLVDQVRPADSRQARATHRQCPISFAVLQHLQGPDDKETEALDHTFGYHWASAVGNSIRHNLL